MTVSTVVKNWTSILKKYAIHYLLMDRTHSILSRKHKAYIPTGQTNQISFTCEN